MEIPLLISQFDSRLKWLARRSKYKWLTDYEERIKITCHAGKPGLSSSNKPGSNCIMYTKGSIINLYQLRWATSHVAADGSTILLAGDGRQKELIR